MSSYLKELAAELNQAQAEVAAELWPPQQSKELIPVVRSLVAELANDQILAEATLSWVRQKKQEIILATLERLYTPEQLAEMRARAEAEAAAAA